MRLVILLFSFIAISTLRSAESLPAPSQPLLPDPDREGMELAAKLRDAMPEGNSRFTGLFQITAKDDSVRTVPIVSTITVNPTNWVVSYQVAPPNPSLPEVLTIFHVPGRASQYDYVQGGVTVKPMNLDAPLAGSDFSLIDLGLEFFHWPKQRRLRHEMRNSRNCHVLESTNPNPAGSVYARVLSWVDIESGGIVRAEAYDRAGKLVKEFKVDRLRKVEGRWQVESMKIRSRATGQETELKFDLGQK